jgi:hypothetical protein
MMDVMENSLYQTVTDAAAHLFLGGTFVPAERDELAAWILAHQNRQRGFSFYPMVAERERGIRLLSGERLQTTLAADNAVEMETLRLLALIQPHAPQVQRLFQAAERRLSGVCYGRVCSKGECAHASLSVLRYHTARGAERSAGMIRRGLEALRGDRTGTGKWRSFPFYYTLLWLAELPDGLDEGARVELSYARGRCERLLSRMEAGTPEKAFDRVRARVLQDALAQVGETALTQGLMFKADDVGVLQASLPAMAMSRVA